jgi:hypothetical protein
MSEREWEMFEEQNSHVRSADARSGGSTNSVKATGQSRSDGAGKTGTSGGASWREQVVPWHGCGVCFSGCCAIGDVGIPTR